MRLHTEGRRAEDKQFDLYGGKNGRWTVKPRKNMYQGSGRLAAEKARMTYLFLPLSTCLSFAGTTSL